MIGLIIGLLYPCNAFSDSLIRETDQQTISKMESIILAQIFANAAPKFFEIHGVTVSAEELHIGYDDGTVTVTKVSTNKYRVVFGGNDVISDLEDSF